MLHLYLVAHAQLPGDVTDIRSMFGDVLTKEGFRMMEAVCLHMCLIKLISFAGKTQCTQHT